MFFFTKKNKILMHSSIISSLLKKQKFSYLHCKASNSLSSNQKIGKISTYQEKEGLKSGDVLNLIVNSLISKKLGIAEFYNGSTIFLPNAKLGDQVKVKIVKVTASAIGANYAIGEIIQIIKESQIEPPVSAGEVFDLTINEKGPKNSGKVTFPNNYSLYIPNAIFGEKVKVIITRVKTNYAFAKLLDSKTQSETISLDKKLFNKTKLGKSKKITKNKFIEGSQWNIVLPKTAIKKSNYVILNFKIKSNTRNEDALPLTSLSFSLEEQKNNIGISKKKEIGYFSSLSFSEENNTEINKSLNDKAQTTKSLSEISEKFILFVKIGLGTTLGDKVRIKITKIIQTQNTAKKPINVALAKIIKIEPISNYQKQQKIKAYLNKMLKNGMHFGDLKCHAFMKKFLWSKTKSSRSKNISFPLSKEKTLSSSFSKKKNKKQESFLSPQGKKDGKIFKKKDRHLLNLFKTRRCLNKAFKQLAKYAASGRTFLFVGTKKPAAGLVARAALLSQNSFYVNTRWLGGMLTNWKTLLKSISKIQPIFREKQKILQNLLEKRYQIKIRLIKKINKLRNQSQQLLKKGKIFVNKIKQESAQKSFFKGIQITDEEKSLKNSVSKETVKEKPIPVGYEIKGFFSPDKLVKKRKQYLQKGTILLTKYQQLLTKKNLITNSFQVLQEKAYQLIMIKKKLIKQYLISAKKLNQLKILLMLSNELQARKNSFNNDSLSNKKKVLTISSKKFPQLDMLSNDKDTSWIVPNPPKEIIQKILKILEQENHKKFEKIPKRQSQTSNTYLSVLDKKNTFTNAEKKEKTSVPIGEGARPEEINPNTDSTIMNNKAILFSKFLNQFSHFSTASENNEIKDTERKTSSNVQNTKNFLKNSIKKLNLRIQNQKRLLIDIQDALTKIQQKMIFCLNNQTKISLEMQTYKLQFISCKKILKNLKKKFQIFSSSQKLLKFLPRLRYLSTSKRKILETVQIFMKKFVDPKLRYPMEKIYEEKLKYQSKKRAATSQKKWQRLEKYFGGVIAMAKLKNQQIKKNVVILIGQQEEMNAVLECKKLGIKMFHLVDTDCNPLLADYVIPTNDDSRNSIQFLLGQILTYIRMAQKIRKKISLAA